MPVAIENCTFWIRRLESQYRRGRGGCLWEVFNLDWGFIWVSIGLSKGSFFLGDERCLVDFKTRTACVRELFTMQERCPVNCKTCLCPAQITLELDFNAF